MRISRVLLAAVVVSACGDSASGPSDSIDADEAALIAVTTDDLVGVIVFDVMGGDGPVFGADGSAADVRAFSRSRPCPEGGEVAVEGTHEHTVHGDGAREWTILAEGEWRDCAHRRNRGEVAITTTIDGSFSIEAHRKRNRGEPIGLQTTEKEGSFDWTRTRGDETRSGSCTFEVSSVRNPETRRIEISGTVCGREFRRELSWGMRA